MDKPKIFGFVNGGSPGWYDVSSITEDGVCLASHCCSHPCYGPHDIGVTSDWKHDTYAKYYPDGFTVEWVENVEKHDGIQKAFALNRAMTEAEHKTKLWMFETPKADDAVARVVDDQHEPTPRA